MHFVFSSVLAFVAFVAAQTADPSISTPASLVQCQPAQISWTATKTPVFISIIPGGQVGASALEDLGSQTGSSLTWNVDIKADTQITFQIRDSAGVTAYSAPITIQSSSDSSCLGQNSASGSPTASGSASSTAAGPSTTQAVPSSVSASVSSVASSAASSASSSLEASTSSVGVSLSSVASTATHPSSASSTRSATATSSSASASASPNAARSNAQVGFAGLLGLVAAAIMA